MILRRVTPSSLELSNKEAYEYLICWYSPFGGIRQWMFSHTNGGREDAYNLNRIEGLTNIRSIPNMEENEVECNAVSLSREDLEYLRSIMQSPRHFIVKKDGSTIPIAVLNGSVKQPNQLKDLEFRLRFVYKEPDLLDV